MKKYLIITCLTLALSSFTFSCGNLQAISGLPGVTLPGGTTTTSSKPTNYEINSALKQALEIGIKQGVKQVSAKNGFFKNSLIKVLFPPEAQKIERTLRSIGMGQLCDKVILSLNRAAEDASKEALPIFINALKSMSFQDATRILFGRDTAATHYFRTATTQELASKFQPVIAKSLNKVDATRYWGLVTTQYNKIPLVQPIHTDLSAYVTQKAIDGLFVMVAKEEKQIRENLASRATPLLKKVFGYADQQQ